MLLGSKINLWYYLIRNSLWRNEELETFFTCFELPDIGNIDPLFLFITEWQRPEGPSEGYLVHLLAQRKVNLSQVLHVFEDKNTTASLNYLCQCLNTLTVRKMFFLSILKTRVLCRLDYCKLNWVFFQNVQIAVVQTKDIHLLSWGEVMQVMALTFIQYCG